MRLMIRSISYSRYRCTAIATATAGASGSSSDTPYQVRPASSPFATSADTTYVIGCRATANRNHRNW